MRSGNTKAKVTASLKHKSVRFNVAPSSVFTRNLTFVVNRDWINQFTNPLICPDLYTIVGEELVNI